MGIRPEIALKKSGQTAGFDPPETERSRQSAVLSKV